MSAEGWGDWRFEFCGEADKFLEVAGEYLGADPVLSTVVTGFAHRALFEQSEGMPRPDGDWWLLVRDSLGTLVGAGMRRTSSEPYPPFLLPMPDGAAVALGAVLHERGEQVLGVNGALPAAELCAAEWARLCRGRVEVAQHTRLHEIETVTAPASVPGRLVAATVDDVDRAMEWLAAFMGDADEQAGRQRGATAHGVPDRAETTRRVLAGELWFWVDGDGRPVHLTAVGTPALGVARVGPVYTPPDERGRGWASNAVAEVSARVLAQGVRVCLYTDQANPTSNKIYTRLGYRPVADMANLLIVREARDGSAIG